MGGYGSGRQFGANCTDEYRWIDVRRWQRDGNLTPGQYLNWQWLKDGEKVAAIGVRVETGQLRLIYNYQRSGSDWESLDYPVRLQTTPCHYGGVRYWFTCPALGCSRRIAVLYLGGKIFACRHCYQLAYRSQRKTIDDRAASRADKIRDKLHWESGILNLPGYKPKGMHWKTYHRLIVDHDNYMNQSLMGIMAKLKINNRLNNF
jgi:hypothetical protein